MSTGAKVETVVVSQPHCYPWLGYMKMIRASDVFIVLDNVQFEKQSWQCRNRVKGPNGPVWLTVPVLTSGRFGQNIPEVLIDNKLDWRRKHLLTLEACYRRAPHYETVMPALRPLLEREWDKLMDFTMAVLKALCELLRFDPDFQLASALDIPGNRTNYLVNVCKHFGGGRYISADGSRAYLEEEKFNGAGVRLEYLGYKHPVYQQLFGEFLPNMSVLDLLFNVGTDAAPGVILMGT